MAAENCVSNAQCLLLQRKDHIPTHDVFTPVVTQVYSLQYKNNAIEITADYCSLSGVNECNIASMYVYAHHTSTGSLKHLHTGSWVSHTDKML